MKNELPTFEFKIEKNISPLGIVTFTPSVKKPILWCLKTWSSIHYHKYDGTVDFRSYRSTYKTLAEAEEAIEKFKESKVNGWRIETIKKYT